MSRILVVEDDPSLNQVLEGLGGPDRLAAVVTTSGEEALRLLDQEEFDILLADLTLPGMDGIELLVRAKQLHPGLRAYAVGSADTPGLNAAALDSGADEILRKPVDFEALLRAFTGEAERPGRLISLDGDFDAADLCLLGALSGRTGGIQATRNGSKGLLALAGGALVHASTGELQGLAAFKRILSWTPLAFDWMPAAAARHLETNVRLDTNWLLKIASWRLRPGASDPPRAQGFLAEAHFEDLLSLLEKKRASGTVSATAEGRFGVLVLRNGQIVQADTEEDHGQKAIQEILSWKTVRASYKGADAGPEAAGGSTAGDDGGERAIADLAKLLDELTGEVAGALATGIVRCSDGRLFAAGAGDPSLAASLSSYAPVVRSHLAAAELLGGGACGNTEDLLITLEKGYLLVRMLEPDHFQGMVLARTANPALARFLMQRFEPLFLEALHRLAGR